jgi:hypothetical protein
MSNETHILAERGLPLITIVTADDLAEPATEAVKDLVSAVREMAGCLLPVVNEGEFTEITGLDFITATGDPGPELHVGMTGFVTESGLTPDDLPPNAYRIVSVGDRLAITGSDPVGVSHGIYDILCDQLGVVYGMVDPLFDEFPKLDRVEIARGDRTEVPDFGARVFSSREVAWGRRNRMDADRLRPRAGHNLHTITPQSEYADHPEYFAFIDGERHVPDTDGHNPYWPCFSNADVLRIAIEKARAFLDENPDVSCFSLCPNDSESYCQCPDCAAKDADIPVFRGRGMNSNSYYDWVATVANAVTESHPGKMVSTYAYLSTELPPTTGRVPDNVVINITQDTSQYFDPDYEKRDLDLLEKWSKVSNNIAVYYYYGLGWHTPRYYPGIIARTIPALPGLNVKTFYSEAYAQWAHMAPYLHLSARLAWDTTLDAEEIMTKWFKAMFHDSADDVRAFYDHLETSWENRDRKGWWFHGLLRIYTHLVQWLPEDRDRAWNLIEAAHENASDPVARARIGWIMRAHRFSNLLSRAYESADKLTADTPDLSERVAETLELTRQMFRAYRDGILGDPSFDHTYYRAPRMTRDMTWLKGIVSEPLHRATAAHPDVRARFRGDPLFDSLMVCAVANDWTDWHEFTVKECIEIYGQEGLWDRFRDIDICDEDGNPRPDWAMGVL